MLQFLHNVKKCFDPRICCLILCLYIFFFFFFLIVLTFSNLITCVTLHLQKIKKSEGLLKLFSRKELKFVGMTEQKALCQLICHTQLRVIVVSCIDVLHIFLTQSVEPCCCLQVMYLSLLSLFYCVCSTFKVVASRTR